MAISVLCRVLGIFLIVLVIAFAAAVALPKGFGYEIYHITVEREDTSIPSGSIAYVKTVQPKEVKTGDIIVYDYKEEDDGLGQAGLLAADKVREIDITHSSFLIGEEIKAIAFGDMRGVCALHLSFMGQFMDIYTTLPGKICLIGIILCGVLLNVLAARIR